MRKGLWVVNLDPVVNLTVLENIGDLRDESVGRTTRKMARTGR